jgi:hypothetical protein
MTVNLNINPDPAIAQESISRLHPHSRTGKEIGNISYTKGSLLIFTSVKMVLIRLYQLEFMGKLISLEETSMDRVDNIVMDFPTVGRHLEGVMKVFLHIWKKNECSSIDKCGNMKKNWKWLNQPPVRFVINQPNLV